MSETSFDIFGRYITTCGVSNSKIVNRVQKTFTNFVDKHYHEYQFSRSNMVVLADILEKKLSKVLHNADINISNIEILLVRNRTEEMIDYQTRPSGIIVKISIAQERFVAMLFGETPKEIIKDGFILEFTPYILQLIMQLSNNPDYSKLDNPEESKVKEWETKIYSIAEKTIKNYANQFVDNCLTQDTYNMHDIVKVLDTDSQAQYIIKDILSDIDDRKTVFVQSVKNRLKSQNRYIEE